MSDYDPSVLQHHVSMGQQMSQGNQRRRGSTIETWDVVAEERLHPEDVVNPQVTGDPIAELQNLLHEGISISRSLSAGDVYSEVMAVASPFALSSCLPVCTVQ